MRRSTSAPARTFRQPEKGGNPGCLGAGTARAVKVPLLSDQKGLAIDELRRSARSASTPRRGLLLRLRRLYAHVRAEPGRWLWRWRSSTPIIFGIFQFLRDPRRPAHGRHPDACAPARRRPRPGHSPTRSATTRPASSQLPPRHSEARSRSRSPRTTTATRIRTRPPGHAGHHGDGLPDAGVGESAAMSRRVTV